MNGAEPNRMSRLVAALALLILTACSSSTTATLVAVYSLQRHGARNVLPKGILLTEGDLIGGPTLLPEGQYQTYTAGAAFRARYIDAATCAAASTCLAVAGGAANSSSGGAGVVKYGVINQPDVQFGNWDTYVRSSALDRTIMSGLCFFNGIFPADPAAVSAGRYLPTGAQVVPVYTQSDADDILIRAYTKCPAYQAALSDWFRSAEFAAQEAASGPLRAEVQAAMPATDTSLQNWWNVYDRINVWRTYGVGDRTPNFTDAQFAKIQSLAYWLETTKMRSNMTRSLLGGPTLGDLLSQLQAAANAVRTGAQYYYKLLSLSGHYNTQLGVLAALELDAYPPAANFTWFRNIPKLAAVMAFELHAAAAPAAAGGAAGSGATEFFVRLVAQDGPTAPYVTLPLPCEGAAAAAAVGAGACRLEDFVAYAAPRALSSAAEWCAACGNMGVSACRMAQLTAQGGGGSSSSDWKIAVSVVVTAVGVALLAGLAAWLWVRRRTASPAAAAAEYGGTGGGGAASGGGSKGQLQAELAGAQFRYGLANTI
ncbi:hypothetical protein GPECTOR_356g120 [Gonium pectorale]|uniref:Uncharacterized protein n=1 Tax=Gonium pectorale TaxID=33097 RepID=A0A150FVH6_GONPE|nr:hypothetical protein GPECTOR_356g120 [Gonium pectorale]|eukprot:KXZ41623.1 hypothetical protein GPECTOR_356g120 [Gonium pectorale]